jgi:predicted nucleic acid-binding Zn ribbon protein
MVFRQNSCRNDVNVFQQITRQPIENCEECKIRTNHVPRDLPGGGIILIRLPSNKHKV